jgi:hypothetical protein
MVAKSIIAKANGRIIHVENSGTAGDSFCVDKVAETDGKIERLMGFISG